MDYHITFEDGTDGYLAHHGVLGMKWGVRNAETQARYAHEKRVPHGTKRLARKDARKAAELKYDYGARSRTARQKHEAVVKRRQQKLGSGYSDEYSKAYSKVDHEKLALKAEKRFQKDRKRAMKSDTSAEIAEKVGGIVGGAVGGMTAGAVVGSRFHNAGATATAAAVGAAVGSTLGAAPGKAARKRHTASRRKLNYSY